MSDATKQGFSMVLTSSAPFSLRVFFFFQEIWFEILGGQGVGEGWGNTPPLDVQKKLSPQTNSLFTTVPPSHWMAAEGGKKGYFMVQKCKNLAAFGDSLEFF